MCVEFVTHETGAAHVQRRKDCHVVVCCSASRLERGDGDQYVQGAGDDTENWAHGLTAELFWEHRNELMLERSENELLGLIEEIVRRDRSEGRARTAEVWPRGCKLPFYIGTKSALGELEIDFDALVHCEDSEPPMDTRIEGAPKPTKPLTLLMGCPSGKLGGKTLRQRLPLLKPFIEQVLATTVTPRIFVTCSNGKDLSVGTALAIFCLYLDDQGMPSIMIQNKVVNAWAGNLTNHPRADIDKSVIRERLASIAECMPSAQPSRATLQSVNTFLIGRPG